MRQRLMDMVVDILKRSENRKALDLITGAEQKPRKIEGWLQIELAQNLDRLKDRAVVTDVTVEKFNHDIVATHHVNGQGRTVGVELKIGLTAAKVKRDLLKLRESKMHKHIQEGYFLFLHLLKGINRKYINAGDDTVYHDQFSEGFFMRELSGCTEEIRTSACIPVEPRDGCKCRCLMIGCIKI